MKKTKVRFTYDKKRHELTLHDRHPRPVVYCTRHPNFLVHEFLAQNGIATEHDFFENPELTCEIEKE